VRRGQRIDKIDRAEASPRSRRFHGSAKGAHDLVDPEAGGGGCQTVEIYKVDVKLRMLRSCNQRPSRQHDHSAERIVLEETTKAFAAYKSGSAYEKNRAMVRHTNATRTSAPGYKAPAGNALMSAKH
jgi:hypothetical protein